MKHILVIDDNVTNLKIVKEALDHAFKVTIVTSGIQGLKFLEKNTPDLILLDIEMPILDGFGVLDRLKELGKINTAPIIFLTAVTSSDVEVRALNLGVVDFINKPFVNATLLSRVKLHLEISDYRKNLEQIVKEKTKMINNLQDAISVSVAELVGCRDGYTGDHVRRTCAYMEILTTQMYTEGLYPEELTEKLISEMLRAAPLHDIGKVGIRDEILCKTGRFTEEEFELMKEHSRLGGETLHRAIEQIEVGDFLYVARDMAFYHHERWDGNGYFAQLKGQDIPLCARIMAVVDVYDALTSKRPYKEPYSHEKAMEIIKEGKGSQFESCIVEVLEHCEGKFKQCNVPYKVDTPTREES